MLILSTLILAVTAPGPQKPAPETSSSPPRQELSPDEARSRAETYLDSIDTRITPAQWRALGPAAIEVLEPVALDATALPSRRARAIAALAILEAPGATKVMQELVWPGRPLPVRLAAVRALGRLTPAGELEPALRPLLERANDARVRAVAAEQLGARMPERACPIVRAQVAREDAAHRGLFGRALSRCPAEQPPARGQVP